MGSGLEGRGKEVVRLDKLIIIINLRLNFKNIQRWILKMK